MREIAFSKTSPGSCPAYGDYFIQPFPGEAHVKGNPRNPRGFLRGYFRVYFER